MLQNYPKVSFQILVADYFVGVLFSLKYKIFNIDQCCNYVNQDKKHCYMLVIIVIIIILIAQKQVL